MQAQVNDLKATLNLQKVENLVNDYSVNQVAGNSTTVVSPRSFQYGGYLDVSGTSTTSNAWVRLEYWFNGKLYTLYSNIRNLRRAFFCIT